MNRPIYSTKAYILNLVVSLNQWLQCQTVWDTWSELYLAKSRVNIDSICVDKIGYWVDECQCIKFLSHAIAHKTNLDVFAQLSRCRVLPSQLELYLPVCRSVTSRNVQRSRFGDGTKLTSQQINAMHHFHLIADVSQVNSPLTVHSRTNRRIQTLQCRDPNILLNCSVIAADTWTPMKTNDYWQNKLAFLFKDFYLEI